MRYRLTLLALLLFPVSATAEQFDFVWSYSAGTQPPQDVTFHVDSDRKTINGYAANITDSAISWESTGSDGRRGFANEINRYTGSFEAHYVSPQPNDVRIRGTCVKPTQRQF